MPLPFSLPDYIHNPRQSFKAALEIKCFGLGTELLGGVIIDDQYYLEGEEASNSFYLIPVDPSDPVPYTTASFYADCLAFEHAVPTLAVPNRAFISSLDIPWIVKPLKRKDIKDLYFEHLCDGFADAATVTSGLWQRVVFKYDWLEVLRKDNRGYEMVRVDFSRYRSVVLPLHLYNAALRQTDPLSQFLHLYRILENVTKSNGKQWISARLNDQALEYGSPIYLEPIFTAKGRPTLTKFVSKDVLQHVRRHKLKGPKKRNNLLEIMRAEALLRIIQLRATMNNDQLAARFYNENRCGIAHGKVIKRHDLTIDFVEILADLKLLRYLARLAIEECLDGGVRPRRSQGSA
jgi:hypothetical protein